MRKYVRARLTCPLSSLPGGIKIPFIRIWERGSIDGEPARHAMTMIWGVCQAALRQLEGLWALLERNQMVSGSFAMAFAGLIWSIAFRVWHRLCRWLSNAVAVKYDFPAGSAPNFALQHWLASRPSAIASSSHRQVTMARGGGGQGEAGGEADSKPKYVFVPEMQSEVLMLFEGRLLWIYEQQQGRGGGAGEGSSAWGSSMGGGWVSTPGSWFQPMQYPRSYDGGGIGGGGGAGAGGAGSRGLTVCVLGWWGTERYQSTRP